MKPTLNLKVLTDTCVVFGDPEKEYALVRVENGRIVIINKNGSVVWRAGEDKK